MRKRVVGVAWVLGATVFVSSAFCGYGSDDSVAPPPLAATTGTSLAESNSPPLESPESTTGRVPSPPPAESAQAPSESPGPVPPGGDGPAGTEPPAAQATAPPPSPEPPAAAGGRVGADLADTLPTVSTMAQSAASLPAPESPGSADEAPEGVEGVVVVPITSNEHVRYDVDYPTAPPAGGPHLGIWLNCGFYTVPVLDELAVHSLEHGAVWVTYRSDVDGATLTALQALVVQTSHLLVSPYEAQEAPLVLSAWGRQLALDSLEDPRFDQFLDVYLLDGPTAPEPGAACSGAVGVPPEHPEAIPQQG